jgi:hypothetical protein
MESLSQGPMPSAAPDTFPFETAYDEAEAAWRRLAPLLGPTLAAPAGPPSGKGRKRNALLFPAFTLLDTARRGLALTPPARTSRRCSPMLS